MLPFAVCLVSFFNKPAGKAFVSYFILFLGQKNVKMNLIQISG